MRKQAPQPTISTAEAVRDGWLKMKHMLVIEGNPLTPGEVAMFEMFDREGWSPEQCRAHIIAKFKGGPGSPEAAE